MNKECKYSVVPVGHKFEYNGKTYIRASHFRGYQVINGLNVFTTFPKHRIVNWLNAYPTQLEK